MTIADFFNVNTTMFTLLGYPMSYLEFFGTLLNIWCVYLAAKNNILTWPIGNLSVVFFSVLFFQIQLYSDFIEQIYYMIAGFYGWWAWSKHKKQNETEVLSVAHTTKKENIIYATIIVASTIVFGYTISKIHLILPSIFTLPASFAYPDTFTTVMSFVATILMARRKVECWYLWIVVDVIGIYLYFTKDVIFISLLYVIFLVIAIRGMVNWRKAVAND